ncbi:MAG: alpha/beta hydrolase [Melioribacteraceae bacterium]
MKKIALILILLSAQLNIAQSSKKEIAVPRDTSFTFHSAIEKILKEYPYARPVFVDSAEVSEKKNIVYCLMNGRELHLDLFSPVKRSVKKLPAVLLVHGGGWKSGARSMEMPMAMRLASSGFVAATVEYRLSPEAKYPAAIYDFKSAVRWLRANSDEFNIDSNKIAIYGCSSGGHLASFIGATNGIVRFEGDNGNSSNSSSVQAVVNIDGILDFTDPAESGKDNDPAKPSAGKLWLGYSFKENPALWIEASPLTYAGVSTPPILFINSSIERFHAGREAFIQKLRDLDIYSEVHTIPDTPHTFWLFNPWFEETAELILSFLGKILKND